MLMFTYGIVVIIMNSFLLPITEDVRICTSKRTISSYVMYYPKVDRELNAFMRVLTISDRLRELKNNGKDQSLVQKNGRSHLRERSLTIANNYRV